MDFDLCLDSDVTKYAAKDTRRFLQQLLRLPATDPLPSQDDSQPPPLPSAGKDEYEVEKTLNEKKSILWQTGEEAPS